MVSRKSELTPKFTDPEFNEVENFEEDSGSWSNRFKEGIVPSTVLRGVCGRSEDAGSRVLHAKLSRVQEAMSTPAAIQPRSTDLQGRVGIRF